MKTKKALLWILKNPMDVLAAFTLVLSILITAINAFTRYCFRYTWNPSTDVVTLCFGWCVFCGSAAAYKRKMHYGIDILISRIPKGIRQLVQAVLHVLMLAAMLYGTYLSIQLMMNVGGKVLPNTKISYRWFDLSAVVGFGYMAFYQACQTFEHFKQLKTGEKEAAV